MFNAMRKRMRAARNIPLLALAACLLTMSISLSALPGTANAALQAVGPVDPVSTLPAWYQDTANLALMPCVDQNGFCIVPPPFDPALPDPNFPVLFPITTTGPINDNNFPGESFYYSADAIMPIEGGELARLTFVLEAAFLGGVIPDAGSTFLRTDLQKMQNLTPNSTYRVTHPYGTFDFTTDAIGDTTGGGGVAVRQEDGFGSVADYLPVLMKAAATTNIGPFLTRADGIFPTAVVGGETHTYIGDALTPVAVTGSPTGNNFYRIERLDAGGNVAATWETNLFVLAGRVFTGQIPSPMTIDRVTYARDATSEQIDVFATALPAASLSISGTGLASTPIPQDVPNTGKFFAHIPVAALPTGVTITNSLDVPPIPYPVTLVDEVNITQAFFNPVTRDLTIKADSRDDLAPLPTLTVPQFAAPNTLDATGTLIVPIPANTIPPMFVTVNSSKLGTALAIVSVIIPPPPPVAVDDAATTVADTAVVINVLANDTTTGTLDPTSILTFFPVDGTAAVNPNGTVTFTPAAGFSGTASFSYSVKDTFGQFSNAATVTITVTAPSGPATGVIVTPTIASPQAPLAQITFIAAGSGGSGSYEYQFSIKTTNTAYSIVGAYSTSNSWTWTPTVTGPYDIKVDVRNAGSTAASEAVGNVFFYQIETPATTVSIAPDLTAPQAPGTPITFTAIASGGSGPFEYRFWVNYGNGYAMTQDYRTTNTFIWTPTKIGIHDILVDVRGFGSKVSRDAFATYLSYMVAPAPATAVTLTPSIVSPQLAGTPITFTAVASGGSGPYEYRFWVNIGGTYVIAQDYTTTNTWTWTPLATGNYDIMVDTRAVGSTLFREALNNIFFYQIQ
jgi:hypothetical protein